MAKAPRAVRATATERVSRPAEPPAPGAQHADTERLGGVRLQKAPGSGWGVGGWQDPQGPCLTCPLSAPQAQTSWELGELARRESTWPQDRADRGSHTSGQLGSGTPPDARTSPLLCCRPNSPSPQDAPARELPIQRGAAAGGEGDDPTPRGKSWAAAGRWAAGAFCARGEFTLRQATWHGGHRTGHRGHGPHGAATGMRKTPGTVRAQAVSPTAPGPGPLVRTWPLAAAPSTPRPRLPRAIATWSAAVLSPPVTHCQVWPDLGRETPGHSSLGTPGCTGAHVRGEKLNQETDARGSPGTWGPV